MMKRVLSLLVLCAVVLGVLCAHAQSRSGRRRSSGLRDLKIMLRDTLGRPLPYLDMPAFFAGERGQVFYKEDSAGDRYYLVRDSDTLNLLLNGRPLQIPVSIFDSITITIRNPRIDSAVMIDPVRVRARRIATTIDTGMGIISADTYAGPGKLMDMRQARHYVDLVSFLRGRVAGLTINADGSAVIRGHGTFNSSSEPLIVLDGMNFNGNLREVSMMIPMSDIESVFVMKDGSWFGMNGANGAIIITTK